MEVGALIAEKLEIRRQFMEATTEEEKGFFGESVIESVNENDEPIRHFDFENHTFNFRIRNYVAYYIGESTDMTYIFSDWSETTSIGKDVFMFVYFGSTSESEVEEFYKAQKAWEYFLNEKDEAYFNAAVEFGKQYAGYTETVEETAEA